MTLPQIEGSLGNKNLGGQNPREIDLVTVGLDGVPHAYEVKRKREKYSPSEFEPKVKEMSAKLFGGRPIDFGCLTMENM